MARLESVALGGFYPTPPSVLPLIANLFEVAKNTTNLKTSFMDPCAGEAEAILYLAKGCEIYACELEASRSVKAKKALGWPSEKNLLTGDAFRISFDKGYKGGVSVLFLNPPYDTDPVHGRLEQKFLERFAGALMEGGFLIFVVPFYALKASATLLGREFDQIECFRFPEGEFEVYKQVVLVAKKGPTLFESDPVLQSRVLSWSADPSVIPVLPESVEAQFKVPSTRDYEMGLAEWKMHEVDMTSLLPKLRPWFQSERRGGSTLPIPGILPDLPVQDLLLRSYPVATPPRPAHIAAGIASGLFNGAEIEPNDAATRLPSLLVKGVFDREYRTVEQKLNKDGEVRSIVQVQQPKLVTTILNLETHQYHTLRSGLEASKEVNVSNMGVVDLLAHYGQSLMNVMERQCPITYDPRRDAASIQLAESPRKMFSAQAHATRALVKLLGGVECSKLKRKGRAAILLGEIGSGKSTVALMTAKTIQAKRPLVMCPPHLLDSWKNEVTAVLPEADVRVLHSVTDLESLSQDKSDRMVISILSRETAKLGHGWADVGTVCPACGQVLEEVGDQAKKRLRCTAKHLVAKGPLLGQCVDYARKLLKYNPTSSLTTQLLRGRQDQLSTAHYLKLALDESSFPGIQKGDLDHFIAAALTEIKSEKATFIEEAKTALVLALLLAGTEDQIEGIVRTHLSSDLYKYDSFWQTLIWLLEPGSERQEAILVDYKIREVSSWSPARPMLDAIAQAKTGETVMLRVQKLELSWSNGALQVDEKSANNIGLATRLLVPLIKMSRFKWSKECGEFLFQAVPEPRRVSLAQRISKRYPALFDMLVVDECFVAGTRVSGKPIETIQVGDTVESYDERSKTFVQRKVTKLWKKEAQALVRVVLSNGCHFVCTPNHPIFANGSWTAAGMLVGGELVVTSSHEEPPLVRSMLVLPDSDHSEGAQGKRCQQTRERLLQPHLHREGLREGEGPSTLGGYLQAVSDSCSFEGPPGCRPQAPGLRLLQSTVRSPWTEQSNRGGECDRNKEECSHHFQANEGKQSYEQSRYSRESECSLEGAYISGPRRERATDETSNTTCGGFESTNRGSDRNGISEDTIYLLAESLQGGHSRRVIETRNRSGWVDTQIEEVAFSRQEEGGCPSGTRVDSVEILERGSDGKFGGLCQDGFVYNLEVEGTHTYFAEGILVHNCHEYSTEGSAQERSAHRLTSLGIPTILQTGTIMNGYAESLFMNMWALSPKFREEFSRDDKQRFIDRYGYRKRVLEDKNEKGEIVEFGSNSDRVRRTERAVGNSPGVLPLFVLRHLLTLSVTLHKADLAIDLPVCKQLVQYVEASAAQMENYEYLKKELAAAIKKDLFDPKLAGRLFGQLAELPSYLDRATQDTGNTDHGVFEVRYPESVGEELVASAEPFSASEILPKEKAMLDLITSELAEGRNVMVFSWHVSLLPRYARIISERLGEVVPILFADKVPTAKRQSWIEKEVVKKKRHIMVTNPVCVQTGLNNLVHFATEIWMENPGCNPIIFRQAIGRVDRIGQKKETRIFSMVYQNTLQAALYDLLMRKVAVSVSTDGLDPESALNSAGVGDEDYFAGLSIGKQLWAMLSEGAD